MLVSGTKIKRRLKKSALEAKQQVDQVLLNFQHSDLQQRLNEKAAQYKAVYNGTDSADLVGRIGQAVLERAQKISESLHQAKNPKRVLKKARVATEKTKRKIRKVLKVKR